MKRIAVLLTMFVVSLPFQLLASEVSSGYRYSGDFGYIYVGLNENTNQYEIRYGYNVTDDILSGMILSSGQFRYMQNNEIWFEDIRTGITMKAIKIKDIALKFTSAYEILDNKMFHLKDNTDSWPSILNDEYSMVVRRRNRLTKSDYQGLLSDGQWQYGIVALALEDDRFRYSMKEEILEQRPWYEIDIKVLEGTWSQNGNLIILHDEHTDHDFYLIYEEPNLRTMLLPGDTNLEGTVLMPQ